VARLHRDVPLALLDLAVVFGAYLVALVIRFEGEVPDEYWASFWGFAPGAAGVYLVTHYLFGLYGQMWRYASIWEARQVVLASAVAASIVLAGSEVIGGRQRILPLSVVALGAMLALLAIGLIRFQSRLFALRRRAVPEKHQRVLIVGGGDAGSMVLRDIVRHPDVALEPVGVIDDDRRKVGRTLHGVPVLGTRAAIPASVERLRVDQVLLAIPSATGDVVREIFEVCEQARVDVRVLPSVREIVDGRVGVRDIRDIRIEDLLGRQLVQTDLAAVRSLLHGRRVLVTGAGGSIGSEIVRQVHEFGPAQLVLLDRDEIHLHDLLVAMGEPPGVEIALADVRDRDHLFDLFRGFRPEIVFHAAAHKHLPILERHPREALLTNVLGTANVAEAASAAGAERFVFISTDKAVRPTSVMGASKWFAEQVVWSNGGNHCAFSVVRFGNVIGSRGGVVQTFLRQVAVGGPVTVTDPGMARYFMSIEEAVQLVLQAAAMSRGGEVFTLEMGEPVPIVDLAREVIRLSGREPDRDIQIALTGPRPGEKLVEDLLDPAENPVPSEHPDITVSRPASPDGGALARVVGELERLAEAGREQQLGERLKALAGVPLAGPRVAERIR
jgi:FlaA1/EpsC-like NDP-sugar epimerase